MLNEEDEEIRFSGLRLAVINYVHNCKQKQTPVDTKDIAATFQARAVEVLVQKTSRAAKTSNVNQLIMAGGVAANSGLRAGVEERFKDSELQILIPPITLCTDNAAMIAAAASIQYNNGDFANWDLNGNPSMLLT